VLADIGEKLPTKRLFGSGDLRAKPSRLLEKHHMPPRRGAESVGVVIGIAGKIETIRRYLIPFLASHLTRLASDTKCCVG
jgi:hypothetical protein